ncbi:serine/threonine-protein kinase [Thaumasiovibrio subtropicus]|uniref:serine/threonine-protein kinase n=1 Tax=Thaumasiovibrio subtropicus TaxID=1891207 RepID=UPI000B34D997|nr:serine/threonine-protein kinase [Thaumasiovibrio subtropicus]
MKSTSLLFYRWHQLSAMERFSLLHRLKRADRQKFQSLVALLSADKENFTDLLQQSVLEKAPAPNWLNQQWDKYRLVEHLGEGGMGSVYLGERCDNVFSQQVAIKIYHRHLYSLLQADVLFGEAEILSRLHHPAISDIIDAGEFNGYIYLCTRYVRGISLQQWQQKQPLKPRQAMLLFSDIVDAIAHAHQHGVVHGDIKPENILIDAQRRPTLIDFNLTQAIQSRTPSPLLACTSDFADVDDCKKRGLTQENDLYALGKLLLWLRAGSAANKFAKRILDGDFVDIQQLQRALRRHSHYPRLGIIALILASLTSFSAGALYFHEQHTACEDALVDYFIAQQSANTDQANKHIAMQTLAACEVDMLWQHVLSETLP